MSAENEKSNREKRAREEQEWAAALAVPDQDEKPIIDQPDSESDALEIKEEALPLDSFQSKKTSSTASPVADQIITIQTTEPKAEQSERVILALIHPSSIDDVKKSFEETKNKLINEKDENGDPKHLKENGQPYTEKDFSYRQSKDESGRTIHVFSTPSEKTRDHFISVLKEQGIARVVTPNVGMNQADQKGNGSAKKFKKALGGGKGNNPDPMSKLRKGLEVAKEAANKQQKPEEIKQEKPGARSTTPKPMSTTPTPTP